MAISPQTDIRLIKCPLTLSNKNQITFSNLQAQEQYFLSLPYTEDTNASYQRKDNVIRFNRHIDSIITYDYCMYKNENYSNKWFYAFITGMRYINDNVTEISIDTDVFQTWQFDLIYKQSFIEREIVPVADDTPGNNLIPEGLEFGELKVEGTAEFDELEPAYVVAYTGDSYQVGNDPPVQIKQEGYNYNGIYSSVTFAVANSNGFNALMKIMNENANSDKVLTVFTVPQFAVQSLLPDDPPGQTTYKFEFVQRNFTESPKIKTLLARSNSLDGYTPRNKKLLTYPYIYLGFNPQNGTKKIYRYEDFLNSTPSFKIMSEINPNPTVQFIPQNYRGANGDSLSDNASLNGYPTISFKTDTFNVWLAQNNDIISLQMQQENYNYTVDAIKGGMGMVGDMGNMLSGNSSSMVGGFNGYIDKSIDLMRLDKNHEFYIKNQMAQIEKQAMLPDNASLSSSNSTLLGYNMFDKNIFTRYTIKSEFAERLDKYFDMYGYTINELKNININSRPNWNYIKTQGANILGNIPQYDLQSIKEMFDNGITFWHNPETFLDYSQNNR